MDPASAVISLISFGFTVVGQINRLRKAIKDAPEHVHALHDSSIAVSLLLSRLQVSETRTLLRAPQAAGYVESLCERSQRSLEEASGILEKIVRPRAVDDNSGNARPHIILKRWIISRDKLERVGRILGEVRKSLCEILGFMQTYHLDHIVDCVDSIHSTQTSHSHQLTDISVRIDDMKYTLNVHFRQLSDIAKRIDEIHRHPKPSLIEHCSKHEETTPDILSTKHRRNHIRSPLKCPTKCECRCHYPSVVKVIPSWLASYIGQVSVSKRLFHPTFSPWSLCNVSTCRGDLHRAIILQWDSPLRFLNGLLQYSKDRRIHFSIGAQRIVPYNSPLFKAIWSGDYHTIRDLFATGRASIWDYDINGLPVFCHVCRYWQQNTNTAGLEILRLYVEAGADALLFEEVDGIVSAHDSLVLGCITYLLDNSESDKNRPIASILRTNSSAISVLRPLFNADPLDALEDFLNRKRTLNVDIASFLASLEDAECDSTSLVSVFEVIGYSPLEYAVLFSPQRVTSLLKDGAINAGESTLFNAILCTFGYLIRPLLDAGADVNIRDWKGYTPLHWACSWCRYNEFFELVRWAEKDIDWKARTRDGRDALDLFDSGVLEGFGVNQSQEQLDEFRMLLVSHITSVDDELDSDEQLHVPGAFPDVT